MIKILVIMTTNIGTSGISKIVMRYYDYIDKKKVKFDFVVPNEPNDYIKNKFNTNNTNVYIIKRKKNAIKYYFELKKIIKNGKYNIVHVHGNSSTMALELMAAKKAGCKVRIAHSHNTTCNHKIIDKMLRPIFYKYLTCGMACGADAGKWLFGKRKFIIIQNGNELSKYSFNSDIRKNIRKENNLENCIVIGHVGRFNYQKNHDFLIEVFNKYRLNNKNAKLLLIGSGEKENEVKEKIKGYNIEDNVIFTGEINNVNEWLNACDVMMLPSRYEGFPVVLIEWQANGVPCIVSNRISKEVNITDTIKFIDVDKEDSVTEWLKCLKKIDKIDREEISNRNMEILRKRGYDIEQCASNLYNIYLNLMKDGNDYTNI